MVSLHNLANFDDLLATLRAKTSGNSTFTNRLDQFIQLSGLRGLKPYWNQDLHKTGTMVKPNAFMFGFVINDWDKSFQSRDPNIKTTDLQIPFQYVEKIPEWKKTANYSDQSDVIGRFEHITSYANSSAQQFKIDLIYQAETRLNSDLRTYWSLERIEQIQKRLQSLVFPTYTKGFMPPPKVLFNIGNIYRSVPVVIKDIVIDNGQPYDVVTGLSMLKKISIEMQTSYPMWQAISGDKIFLTKAGNGIFAYKEISQDYTQTDTARTNGGVRNYNG